MAVAGCATIAWLGLYGFAWSDYEVEARAGVRSARPRPRSRAFLRLAPAYGGSLVERAPFALLPGLWGGGALAVYRTVAAPCLLAAALLGVVPRRADARAGQLDARARGRARAAASPTRSRCWRSKSATRRSCSAPCLCVAAVLLAAARRGVARARCSPASLLGLAIANKEWALLAVGPVLLALPAGAAWSLPGASRSLVAARDRSRRSLLAAAGGFVTRARAAVASAPSAIFQPWQVWWFLGHHGALVHGLFGAPKPGYRDRARHGPARSATR